MLVDYPRLESNYNGIKRQQRMFVAENLDQAIAIIVTNS